MKPPAAALWQSLAVIAGIAAAWTLVFSLNSHVMANMAHSERANWVFLPASLRLLAVLIFRGTGALGLIAGSYVTVAGTTKSGLLHELGLALSSGLAPWLGVLVLQMAMQIPSSLAGLRPHHIALMAVVCATANAVLLNGFLWWTEDASVDVRHILAVFLGDVTGIAIGMFVITAGLGLFWRFTRNR